MAMFLNSNQEKSELQQKITAELRENTSSKPKNEGDKKLVSFKDTDEPDYSKNIQNNNINFWISAAIAAVIVGVVVYFSVK